MDESKSKRRDEFAQVYAGAALRMINFDKLTLGEMGDIASDAYSFATLMEKERNR